MTHEELLAKLNSYIVSTQAISGNNNFAIKVLKALHAVVELHKPLEIDETWCSCDKPLPCSTIVAIEKELQ